jgi:hypothetical protein
MPARSNVGRQSISLSGRNATKLSNTPQPQPGPYKPNQFGATDASGTGPKPVPPPPTARPQAATPTVPRVGTREIARVDGAGLVR